MAGDINSAPAQKPITDSMYLINKQRDERKTGPGTMDKDAFMQILIAQMANQDPTNPMKDNEFIAQMAQFSSLEQTMNLAKAFERFADAQNQSQLIQYNSFIGKDIRWHEMSDKKDEEGKPIINEGSGTIQSIKYMDGSVIFTLADGKELSPGNISEVIANGASGGQPNNLVQASMLIGKTIGYMDGEEERTGKVSSVTNKAGKLNYILQDGKKIEASQFISISE
ncbi:flagellar hook assembly protein FlgD [Sporosarcina sp. GW1-11]|uniref:flagellar hook capping FlgD N-terminal domain-containing protein n=1 Tax=Sporosarcina sp. GW1-11 TaxID=2899126 RepID=UPI00294F6B03|nr:flagellar hook capping FlgD N-terminal domain-containing protein [Sporosarcina sp. GW1-11]MDV6376712.1 flagellar hook assembly protein FlgD [Sporosarcina sp. GW1-11]